MLLSRNFENVIKGAYRWLSERYKAGDRIYLFGASTISWLPANSILTYILLHSGFSRGAYQVRVLAGMIEKVLSIFAIVAAIFLFA